MLMETWRDASQQFSKCLLISLALPKHSSVIVGELNRSYNNRSAVYSKRLELLKYYLILWLTQHLSPMYVFNSYKKSVFNTLNIKGLWCCFNVIAERLHTCSIIWIGEWRCSKKLVAWLKIYLYKGDWILLLLTSTKIFLGILILYPSFALSQLHALQLRNWGCSWKTWNT